jgi:polyisoprenoid-binding protein YceI
MFDLVEAKTDRLPREPMQILRPLLLALPLAGIALSFRSPGERAHAPSAPETYEVDPVHSSVVFRTKHMGISHFHGRFNGISGEKSKLVYDPEDPTKSSILLVIDAESIDTANANRDRHLKSPDFLSTKENPEIVFESKQVSGTSEALEVAGDLTLHGVTRPITAKAQVIGRGEVGRSQDFRTGFDAHFTVDMPEFEFEFVKQNPGSLGPEVDLTISLQCVRK